MKRAIKIPLVALASLLLLVLLTLSILVWFVFTPEKLTPIVRNQSEKYIPYQTEIGEVELTVFSTFPRVGIRVSNFAVYSPFPGAASDTLLKADELVAVMDARAFRKNREIIVNKFILSDTYLNVYTDSLGQSNYGLFITETPAEPEEPSEAGFSLIELQSIELKNLNLNYTDLAARLHAVITGLTTRISGNIREDKLKALLDLSNAGVTFEYDGEKYLEHALLKLKIPAEVHLSGRRVQLNEAYASVNGLAITVNGSIESDSLLTNFFADLSYQANAWQIEEALALVPPAYLADLGDFRASGMVSSKGMLRGPVNDSLLPSMDIHLSLADGSLSHDLLPFPVERMSGDIRFFSDQVSNPASWLQIGSFEAQTPHSVFRTRGRVNHLFSDMQFELTTDADILLDELRPLIPDEMDLDLKGRINGQLKTTFTMSQATDLALEKMKVSGSAFLSDFGLVYDSLSLYADRARVEFALPNQVTSERNTRFASARISSDNLAAGKIDDFSTSLKKAHIYLEMSDVRDTTRIPDLFCTFSFDALQAEMDSMGISVEKPLGYLSVSPVPERPDEPAIQLAYTSYGLNAHMGRDSAVIGDITIRTDIVSDNSQEDVFLQWLANGMVDMKKGSISLSGLTVTLEIPAVRMDFTPETFRIHESSLRMGPSDFGLTGVLNNVLSYFRGDSLLRGDFSFTSGTTDIAQLMYLTSGIGTEERSADENPPPAEEDQSFSGPYMVPRGMDVILRAGIDRAVMGTDTATNIRGDVRINDGILLLDGLTFTTPAADMQLTAMYRTPRKNHLYLGMNYHMIDVEIDRLLEMIPDIDTLMPMLRSFKGAGEFHIAVETYLDSAYNIKKSTLRGASSIRGQDLVLMDGETFSEIAKTLRFSKKAENRVDSISAEFTIFRDEIDVYPFLVVMDRYKAVVAGRHNFDMSFDYHISLVESPLPVRLGIDINGTMEQMKYRLASPRYAEFFRPVSRRAVESRQLELRRMIREALLQNVRE